MAVSKGVSTISLDGCEIRATADAPPTLAVSRVVLQLVAGSLATGELRIDRNPLLPDLLLPQLRTVGRRVWIYENHGLSHVRLPQLQSVYELWISELLPGSALVSVSLPALEDVGW